MTRPVGKVRKLIGLRWGLPYVRQADRHRDQGEWIDAVILYHRGLEWMPWREDLKVQIGNCLKEFGDYYGSIRAYRSVADEVVGVEAQAQLSDVVRRAGNLVLPYAVGAEPNEPEEKSSALPRSLAASSLPNRLRLDKSSDRRWLGSLGRTDRINPRIRGGGFGTVKLDQVGSMSLERNRMREAIFTGVVAVRGRILSFGRINSVEILGGRDDNQRIIAVVPVTQAKVGPGSLKLFVFNAWIDSGQLKPGRTWLMVRATRKNRIVPAGLFVNVMSVEDVPPELLSSSSFVPSPSSGGPVDEGVIAARAEVRPARRSLFERPINSILVVRADQLGDLSATLPAMLRLRELYPAARITALVQPGVEAIVSASGVADEVLNIKLDYDMTTERRHLSIAEERRVRKQLNGYDLAIDLCPGGETRPLLLLCDATYMVGFEPDRFPFLDFGISVRSHDKVNRLEKLSHAAHVASLVEALAVVAAPSRAVVPRVFRHPQAIERNRLKPGKYVVLHTGARHALNQWPLANFVELATKILVQSDLDVALFGEPGAWITPLSVAHGDRVRLLPMLDPDAFDQIISSARVMVGNDSGPKHLAAVRGVPTVSVHVGRLNWNEWGQEGIGAIVAKRVPCAGCGLNDIALCGRDAVCVRSIAVEDVFSAVQPYL